MTVVVVLEFTAGATLCKGLNRGLGTLSAGVLALAIGYIAKETDHHVFQSIFIGALVCVIGAAATYIRFFPYLKKNYDYGVVIFLVAFNLITASSFHVTNVLKIALERFYTIAIGCGICLSMSLVIFPIWSGEDLHNSTVLKLEACVYEYFSDTEKEASEDKSSDDPIYEGYKKALDSKSQDETLTPRCWRALFKDPCNRLASEVSKALMELAKCIRNHQHCSPEILSDHLHQALQDLNAAIKSQPRLFIGSNTKQTTKEAERKVLSPQLSKIAMTSLEFSEALPFAAFASLLVEIVAKLDNVIEQVEELGRVACFKESDEVIINCETPKVNHLSTSDGAD